MSGTPPRPNFFLLLGLNPDDRWDQGHFEATLKEKQRQWGLASTGIGPKAQEARRNVGLISQIQQVMSDATLRDQEAVEARREIVDQKKARVEKLEKQLQVAQSKGFLEEEEFKKIVAEFKDVLSEAEIRARLSVSVRSVASGPPKPEQLEASLAKEIAQKLEQLGLADLYELLLGKPSTPPRPRPPRTDLYSRANQLYTDMVKRPPAHETTLRMELSGPAMKVFATDDMQAKYDATLRQGRINALLKDLSEIVERTVSKEVHEPQIVKFLENAGNIGWGRVEAMAELKEYAQKRKWTLLPPPQNTTPQQRCSVCDAMNDLPSNYCRNCKSELNLACPNCGTLVEANAAACGMCRFNIGDRFEIDARLEQCDQLLAKKKLGEAQAVLQNLEAGWRPKKADTRLERIRECRAKLDRLVQEQRTQEDQQLQAQQRVKDRLDVLLKARKFYEAQRFLHAQPSTMPDRGALLRQVETAIAGAQRLLAPARTPGASYDDRVAACEQALAACADYEEAGALLTSFVPPAPQGLQFKEKDTLVSLSWKAASAREMSYHIVRKKQGHPSAPTDGLEVKTLKGLVYDDPVPNDLIGVPLYYAVYAEYKGVISAQAALLAHPVFLTQEVAHLAAQVNHHLVELSWQPPTNVQKVVVVRKDKVPPRSLADADAVRVSELEKHAKRVADRGVKDGQVYYYGVYCQFRDHEGRVKTTSGMTIRAVPEAPPGPPEALELREGTSDRNEVCIGWQRVNKGELVILRTESQPPAFKVGRAIPESELNKYGKLLKTRTSPIIDTWQQTGVMYYTPVVTAQGTAYPGQPQRYVGVENVRDLRYKTLDSIIRLSWTWPDACEHVVVYASNLSWPLVDDPTPASSRVSRAMYERIGYYDLPGTANQSYYIVVAAETQVEGARTRAAGARIEARLVKKMVVDYEISQPTFLRRKYSLRIRTKPTGALPALWLVSKPRNLPFRKEDGEVVLRIESQMVNGREIVLDLPGRYPPDTYVRLFLEDDQMYHAVEIQQPDMQKLRLS